MSLLNILHHLSPIHNFFLSLSSLHFAPYPPLTSFPLFREEVVVGGEFRKEVILLKFTLVFSLGESWGV